MVLQNYFNLAKKILYKFIEIKIKNQNLYRIYTSYKTSKPFLTH
jgi:hypothetical protein